MNIVFLIGNGFDLNIGLKTAYRDFLGYYLNQNSRTAVASALKEDIKNNIETWSDLEKRIGAYLSNVDSPEEAIEIYNDITEKLKEYIRTEESKYVFVSNTKLMLNDLSMPEQYLRPVDRNYIRANVKRSNEDWSIKIISFNYTTSLEKVIPLDGRTPIIEKYNGYQRKIEDIEHIHGYVNKRMVLGVNDISQIDNDVLKNNARVIRRYVKPECNNTHGLEHDLKCTKWINSASIICIYGMSLGDTDRIWWETIGKHLVSHNAILIVFWYDESFTESGGPDYADKADEVKTVFYSCAKLSDNEIKTVSKRIFISFTHDIFNLQTVADN